VRSRRVALVLIVALLALGSVTTARASGVTYVSSCPAGDTACDTVAEHLEAVRAELELQRSDGVPLSGDAKSALVESRQALGYLLGLVALGVTFVPVFWRTFGSSGA
jgi:uncharacterized protein involved in cysteine biosynthesis